jgi:hypothetical protein
MDHRLTLLICILLATAAAPAPTEARSLAPQNCPYPADLVIVSGRQLPALLGSSVQQLSLFRWDGSALTPITFQIDRKDAQDRYILDSGQSLETGNDASAGLDDNDELSFSSTDAGARLLDLETPKDPRRLTEIELPGGAGWVYAGVSVKQPRSEEEYLNYDARRDEITARAFKLRFDPQLPFLITSFQWQLREHGGWSEDMVDTMKIRHRGRFLDVFPFERTQGDYTSRLVAVKAGPLRVIRRTENHVRMLWSLQSPAVQVEYVVTPRCFIMDTLIDLPFEVGLFFSDVETLTTVDWRAVPDPSRLSVQAPGSPAPLQIDGHMSPRKNAFNEMQGTEFTVSHPLGAMTAYLSLPADAPIKAWLYLRDAQNEPDPPEHERGQFGNVGFRTRGWEQLDAGLQRLRFHVCLSPAEN